MIILYLILMCVFLIFGMNLCKITTLEGSRFELCPRLILVISFFMYSVAMPISRLLFDTAEMIHDEEYMGAQLLGAFGILIGLLIQYKYIVYTRYRFSMPQPMEFKPTTALVCMTLSFVTVMYSALNALGWDLRAIFNPYGYESTLLTGNEEASLFGSILALLTICSIIQSFIGAYKTNNKRIIRITLLFAAVFSLFYLLRGSRNLVGMMLIPLICVYFNFKPIKLVYILISCILLYFMIYTIGVARNIGVDQVSYISIERKTYDPLTQEFGTNHGVFSKWKQINQDAPLLLGESYTIGLLYNLIPISMWPDRPPGAAVQFSMDYFGISQKSNLSEGLGFSPIVEALMNFGYFGIVPIFAGFALLVTKLEYWLWNKNSWGIASFAFMIPMLVNWNRIDMATTSKMFIIFLVISKLLSLVLYRSRPQ